VDEGLAAAEVQLALIVPEWENVLAERARLSAVASVWREVEAGLTHARAGEPALIPLPLA